MRGLLGFSCLLGAVLPNVATALQFYSVDNTNRNLIRYEENGSVNVVGPTGGATGEVISELAFLGNRLIAYGFNPTGTVIGEINISTGQFSQLSTLKLPNGNPAVAKALTVRGNQVFVGYGEGVGGSVVTNKWGSLDLNSGVVSFIGDSVSPTVEFEGAASSPTLHLSIDVAGDAATGVNRLYTGSSVPTNLVATYQRSVFGSMADAEFVEGKFYVRGFGTNNVYVMDSAFGIERTITLGTLPTSPSGFAALVPEPTSIAAIGIGILGLARRKKRVS